MFPILSLNKYYIIFNIYSINNLLFQKYKYRFELFDKRLNINSSSNYNIFGNSILINNNNRSFYLIKKSNITIYEQDPFILLNYIIIIFYILNIFIIKNNLPNSKYYIV
jgi:hypothetical protein